MHCSYMATKRTKTAPKARSVTITFRGTREDTRRLAALAKHYDRTASDVLRRLIAEETARVAVVAGPLGTPVPASVEPKGT